MESKKKYKVATIRGYPVVQNDYELTHIGWAKEMRETYGLTHLTVDEIIAAWRIYSEGLCAGWLTDDKQSIELVFKVDLEEKK